MACDKFGCLVRPSGFDMRDKLAMLAQDRCTPGKRKIEAAANGSKHFAMFPPKLGGMAVVVLPVHDGMKGGVQFAMPYRVGKVVLFNEALDAFEFTDVLHRRHIHEPARQ